MDTVKTGKFLARLRHEKELTQEQLGAAIGVSNKTISRWENGSYMPPVEMLEQLSAFYQVSINELLCGERLDELSYRQYAEKNLKTFLAGDTFSLQERITYYKKKWRKDHAFTLAASVIVIAAVFATGILLDNFLKYISLPAGLIWSIVLYNRMMTYVEEHAFNGTGNQCNI